MAHRTAIYVIFDAASVLMIAPELPEPYVRWKCFVAQKLSLSGELHQMTHFSFKFTSSWIFIHLGPFASDPALDDHVFQNMVWRPDPFCSSLLLPVPTQFPDLLHSDWHDWPRHCE
jgi:hypothetical protein